MEGRRKASTLEEGLRNTEIKRETDIRNSLGPQEGSERSSSDEGVPDSDAYGRETPGRSEDSE
jgi:hypothetical protein